MKIFFRIEYQQLPSTKILICCFKELQTLYLVNPYLIPDWLIYLWGSDNWGRNQNTSTKPPSKKGVASRNYSSRLWRYSLQWCQKSIDLYCWPLHRSLEWFTDLHNVKCFQHSENCTSHVMKTLDRCSDDKRVLFFFLTTMFTTEVYMRTDSWCITHYSC